MVSLYRLSQCRIPALIAIIAILLLFIAPDVSMSLEHQRSSVAQASASENHSSIAPRAMHNMDMSGMSMDDMSAMHAPPEPSTDAPPADHVQHHTMPDGTDMKDGFACGYCQLLVHFPLLLCLFIPLLWLLFRLASRVPPPRMILWFPAPLFPGTCQPRAPPAC